MTLSGSMTPLGSQAGILEHRELRRAEQQRLLTRWASPIVTVTAVAPRAYPSDDARLRVHTAGVTAVVALAARRGWPVLEISEATGPAGVQSCLAIQASVADLKRALIEIESGHRWGRLFDLDVITESEFGPRPTSRSEFGLAPRTCLLCSRVAHDCSRSARHDAVELSAAVAKLVTITDAQLAWLAAEALRVEVSLSPKPGLVDAFNNGAHADMDLRMFLASADVLEPWFDDCLALGLAGDIDPHALLQVGVAAERDMVAVTGGVNTHRGAIFSMGTLLAAAGWCRQRGLPLSESNLSVSSAEIAHGLVAAQRPSIVLSNGQRVLEETGMRGARGEAMSGFASVRRVGLPAYRARLASTGLVADALLWTLVALLAGVDDTNLVSRGGLEGLDQVRTWAERLQEQEPDPKQLIVEMTTADEWFTSEWWSPGGSADLLALTWFLAQICE